MMDGRPRDHMGRVGPEKPKGPCFRPPKEAALEGKSGEARIEWMRHPDGSVEIMTVNGSPLREEEESSKIAAEEGPEAAMDDMEGT